MQYATRSLKPTFSVTLSVFLTFVKRVSISALFLMLLFKSAEQNLAGELLFFVGLCLFISIVIAANAAIAVLISFTNELIQKLKWWKFDPQPTTRIIHPAEALSHEKRKVMFKTWEKNWIRGVRK